MRLAAEPPSTTLAFGISVVFDELLVTVSDPLGVCASEIVNPSGPVLPSCGIV